MVESVKNTVNRIEVQRGQDRKAGLLPATLLLRNRRSRCRRCGSQQCCCPTDGGYACRQAAG